MCTDFPDGRAFGTTEETVFGTNSKESDERVYMGLKKEWYCQRCGTVVKKATPTSKDFPQGCSTCKRNRYLCDKNVGVVVEVTGAKPRGQSNSYSMARIFHTESKDTPFEIDTAAEAMRVTIPEVPGDSTLAHGTLVYKLATKSVSALRGQLGRGLVGTVAENVDRSRPEVVVVQPIGGGNVVTIENPQFAVLYTDDVVAPVSQNLPTTVDPMGGDIDAPLAPTSRTKRRRDVPVMADTDEDLFADALDPQEDVTPPPATRQRTSLNLNVYFDYESEKPILIEDIHTLEMLITLLNAQFNRFGDDSNDIIIHLPSRDELTQKMIDDAISDGVSTLEALVYSTTEIDHEDGGQPMTALRDVQGMMSGGNPLMMAPNMLASNVYEEGEDEEEERLVDDEEEEEDIWNGRAALDADEDARMNTPFEVEGKGFMTLAQYLEDNPDLLPWVDYIAPHRLSMLEGVSNPFLVLSAMFFEGAVTESQRYLNMHNNAHELSRLGLADESFDERFLNGTQWDVNMIANAREAKRQKERRDAERRAIKARKAEEQEEGRVRRKQERENAGMVRAAAKQADKERRITESEDKRRSKRDDMRRKEEEKQARKNERQALRDIEKLVTPGLRSLETNEERTAARNDATERYRKLPWAQESPPGGVAQDPKTKRPIVYKDVPEIVRNALFWLMAYRLHLHLTDPLTNEMLFRNINRYYGRVVGAGGKQDLSKRQWRSWQLQRKIPGTSGFLGQYIESILAALVNAASIVDPRLDSSDSALSWIVWILDPVNAELWLRDPVVVQGLQEQEHHPMGRNSSRAQDKYDAEFRARNPNWFPPTPTTLDIPNLSVIPNAPPPPLPADPLLPIPPPHPPPAPPSDVGSSVAGSSSDPLPPTPPPPISDGPPNMEDVTQLVDLHNTVHPDDMNWGLQDAMNLLGGVGGDLDRAVDILVPDSHVERDEDEIKLNVQMMGATQETARFLRDEGVSTAQIVATGLFDISNLIDVFSIDSLVSAGITPLDLLHAGGSVSSLRSHLSQEILRQQGFGDDDM